VIGYEEPSAGDARERDHGEASRQRVVVSLHIDRAAIDGEAEIGRVQAALLDSLPTDGFELVRRYRYLPQLVLNADAETLRLIGQHPAVSDVRPDRPMPPANDLP
jgi:hypothetical protein